MVPRDQKIGIILLTLTLAGAVGCISPTSRKQGFDKRNITSVELHDGDIAFRRGRGIASDAVLLSNNRGTYSHVGILSLHEGEWHIIHEVPFESKRTEEDRICREPIEKFFDKSEAYCGAIYRMDMDSLDRSRVMEYVMHHFEAKTPFDHDYSLDDDDHLYCSELVWRAYLTTGRDLSQGRRTKVTMPPFQGSHIMPADIELNDSLQLIFSY